MVLGILGDSEIKEFTINAGDTSLIPGWGRCPGKKQWQPTPVLPGQFHGQRCLVGYSAWGQKRVRHT